MSQASSGAPRILVVDDEPTVRQTIALVLSNSEYGFETVASGDQALALVRTQDYALVLTDMKMPGMDGRQLAKQLKLVNPSLPVILLTAFPPADAFAHFYAILLKPFSLRDLRSLVSSALSSRDNRSGPHRCCIGRDC